MRRFVSGDAAGSHGPTIPPSCRPSDGPSPEEGLKLLRAFQAIACPETRSRIVSLVCACAEPPASGDWA